MKKKIIFFCPSIEEGGVEKNLFLMANKLSENYNINVLSANKEKRKMFAKKVKFYSTKNFDLDKSPRVIKSIYCSFFFLIKYFNEKKYNLNSL